MSDRGYPRFWNFNLVSVKIRRPRKLYPVYRHIACSAMCTCACSNFLTAKADKKNGENKSDFSTQCSKENWREPSALKLYKKDKMADGTPQRLCVSHSPWMGPISAGRGWVISVRLAKRFGSRYGTNAKSLRGFIGPISTPNDYLTTVLNDAWELKKHFPPTVPMAKALTCCNSLPSLSLRVKSLSFQERNMLFVDHPVK